MDSHVSSSSDVDVESEIAMQILESCTDGSVLVRKEALIAIGKFLSLPEHNYLVIIVALEVLRASNLVGEDISTYGLSWVFPPGKIQEITNVVAQRLEIHPEYHKLLSNGSDSEGSLLNMNHHGSHHSSREPGQSQSSADSQFDNKVIAAKYLGLWFGLFEMHGRDPNEGIRRMAAALINWIHVCCLHYDAGHAQCPACDAYRDRLSNNCGADVDNQALLASPSAHLSSMLWEETNSAQEKVLQGKEGASGRYRNGCLLPLVND
jgi:hypothetical protein